MQYWLKQTPTTEWLFLMAIQMHEEYKVSLFIKDKMKKSETWVNNSFVFLEKISYTVEKNNWITVNCTKIEK